MDNKKSAFIGKILLSAVIVFFSIYAGFLYILVVESHGADYRLSVAGAVLFPACLIYFILVKEEWQERLEHLWYPADVAEQQQHLTD